MRSKKHSKIFGRVKLSLSAIGFCGFVLFILIPNGSPVFAQTEGQIFSVKDSSGQKVGDVQYNIVNGTVDDMSVDVGANSLYIPITTAANGTLTVTLPRTLIDATTNNGQDDQFYVLLDGQDSYFQESKTNIERTLTVPFPDGTSEIDVVGTYVVPEFPTSAAIVFAIAIISIVVVSTRAKIRIN